MFGFVLLAVLSFSSGTIVTSSSSTLSDDTPEQRCVLHRGTEVEICYHEEPIRADFFDRAVPLNNFESAQVDTSSNGSPQGGSNTIGKYFRADGSRIADEPNAPMTFKNDLDIPCDEPYDFLFVQCWRGFFR